MHRIIAALLISVSACASAQAAIDPPARVARLAYLRGPVSFSPAGTDDWALASLNRPLIAGDRLWTDRGGRDELQLGGAAIRMDANTLLTVLTLDDNAVQVQLAQGTLNVRVRPGGYAGTVEVDTPNMAVSIQQPGHYRVSVDPAGDTTIIRVDDGQAQAIGQHQAYLVNPGQAFRFSGPDLRSAQGLDPRARDDFDRWTLDRDRRAERARAVRYVSPAMIGYDDLDDYGTWRTVADYGPVWVPSRVPRGWAPYRDGHWAWIEPWGWTWIDDAPWGFAVTHYGRWTHFGDSWGWVPGQGRATPVYAPALVVFASAASLAVPRWPREQSVAWFPLGPRESYRPPYQASPRYLTAINSGNARANNVYANRQVDGAMTAVPTRVFARAQPVRSAAVVLPRDSAARVSVSVAPQVQAQRESRASHLGGGHRPAQALLARGAMTHMQPAIAGGGGHRQQAAQVPAAPLPAAPMPRPMPVPQHPVPMATQGPQAHGNRGPFELQERPGRHHDNLATQMPPQAGNPVPMPAQVPPVMAGQVPHPPGGPHGQPGGRGEDPRLMAGHEHGAAGRQAPVGAVAPLAPPQRPAPQPPPIDPPGWQAQGAQHGQAGAQGHHQRHGDREPPAIAAVPRPVPVAPMPAAVPPLAAQEHGHQRPTPGPRQEPPGQASPPIPHEAPHMAPLRGPEPPHPAPVMAHEQPHPAPVMAHEQPHAAPQRPVEPPPMARQPQRAEPVPPPVVHPAPAPVVHQPPPMARANPPARHEPPPAPAPHEPPHAAPPHEAPAAQAPHPGKADEHGGHHGDGGKHKDENH